MTSRLFWKLFLAFAFVQLLAVIIVVRVAIPPSTPASLQWRRADGTPEGAPQQRLQWQVPENQTYEVHLTVPETAATNGGDGTHSLSPGTYTLEQSLPPQPAIPWGYLGLAIAVQILVTGWLVNGVVRAVRRLTLSANQMSLGNYDDPIYVGKRDELGQLAAAFNSMRQKMGKNLARMRDTNQRMSTVLGGMTDGVIAIDAQQQVLFANRAAGEMLSFSPLEAQGKTLLECVRSHSLHGLVVSLLSTPGQRDLELEWGDESPRSLLVNATSFAGEPSTGIVMMIHNLTEEKRLESMRRDFVANVSHELKTPLSSIKAYAETLSQGAIEDEAHRRNFVQEIEEQADRLNQLISDLLSLARIEQGQEELEISSVPVKRVADLCVREQRRSAEANQIGLVLEGGPEGATVEANEDRVRQMLINLIDNAIKYTPAGGTVTVRWRPQGPQIAIDVIDTGIGIAPEFLPRVFERFFRVDKARSREMGGTGLGLAIVKHLAQSCGGSVEVTSEVGQGSQFTVRLPSPSHPPSRPG